MSSTQLRNVDQRRADVIAALEQNRDQWLATSSPSGRPHLIAVSTWWDGTHVVFATAGTSRTARNLDATAVGRLALGSPDDVVMIDVRAAESVRVAEAPGELRSGFLAAAGWDPAEEAGDWRFFRLLPTRIQAYRGYGELEGREIMRDGRWLS
jgi:Pyridoxamine 5'-phosphate oxidase